MIENKSNIALLLGDPAGIGPELVSKLLNDDITEKAVSYTHLRAHETS